MPGHFRHTCASCPTSSALDLAESFESSLAELGRTPLDELASGIDPLVASPIAPPAIADGGPIGRSHGDRPHERRQHSALADDLWDDRAERDARELVALLFVAGGMRRIDLSETLRISSERLDRARAFLHASPPHGLALLESGDRLELVSAPECGQPIERFLGKAAPEPLSHAALEVLSIVAYARPITRADISQTRGTDSSGLIETLLARGLIQDDPRFGGRGRPSFLVTTEEFLRVMGVSSLTDLPPPPVESANG